MTIYTLTVSLNNWGHAQCGLNLPTPGSLQIYTHSFTVWDKYLRTDFRDSKYDEDIQKIIDASVRILQCMTLYDEEPQFEDLQTFMYYSNIGLHVKELDGVRALENQI